MRNVSPTFMKSVEEGAKLDSVADANKNIDNTDDYDDLQVQFMLPLLEEGKDENESESDDGYHDLEMKCRNQTKNEQFIREVSNSSMVAMNSPAFCMKKKISKFYRKQSDLMENFKKDSTISEESQRRRQKQHSISSEKDFDSGQFLMDSSSERTKSTTDNNSSVNGNNHIVDCGHQSAISKEVEKTKSSRWLALATFIVNLSLVVVKAIAAYLSGSLSIISSLLDSAVDITSGLVIWLTARAIKKRDPYMYPRGRTRLEPIALIIVSVIMGVASIQMIVQSVESILRNSVNPHVDIISLSIMIMTILMKFTLMMLCRRYNNPSINVLGLDHRNDCISNFVAIFCAWIADRYWIYLDPIGAIVVSIYIATTWFLTGKEHLAMLSGKSAKPEFINRIVKICMEHDKRIEYIDTVYVYHYGTRFLVEVHIVMDRNMTLQVAHDISESLQINIESLIEVERAFVHCDYEFEHVPADEHKVV